MAELSDVLKDVQATFTKRKNKALKEKVGLGSDLRELTENDYIKLGPWWTDPTKTYGLPFGKLVTIAGTSDSGKTSVSIQAMKAALEQGCGVIYAETENKTTESDLKAWGVDPSQVIIVSSQVAEELYELLFATWDSYQSVFPDKPLLVIVDSIGNLISLRDEEIDLMEQNSQPGGKGKANRLGVSKMIAKMSQTRTAVLLISYTYENMGSVGKTTAGGQALHFYSSLMYQTQRKSWLERTKNGEIIRVGAEVIFTLMKNHLNKSNPGAKKIVYHITANGIECKNKFDEDNTEV
jgi:recombination protein RecA